jgi:crotonobetainyl-CoA:carnitine CoA-transferase CaiB-like acyl-CoA transferase
VSQEIERFADGALTGVRILDLARVVAGPYVSRVLGDMGAEVIKVEPPEGDVVRFIAPNHDQGMSAFFHFVNVGKSSICVDLKTEAGKQIVRDLFGVCDAVVENFRPGVLDRLGLGWETLQAANPRAILLSLNGFGSNSAWSERRAYAPILHAITGILHDQAEYAKQPVAQINHAYADTTASLHGTVALLAALRVAEATGIGQRIEVPMYDAVLSTYSEANNALLPEPDDRTMNPIYDAASLGVIACAGAARLIWRLLVASQGLDDPAPKDAEIPVKARARHDAIERWMSEQPSREALLATLEEAGIACAPVVPILEALTGPLAKERELLVEVDDRRGGTRPLVRPPARFSVSRNEIRERAPRRGEHNRVVLGELLSYSDERIKELEDSTVITAADPRER